MKNKRVKNYYNGELQETSGVTMPIHSPLNNQIIGEVIYGTTQDLDALVEAMLPAQRAWGKTVARKRAEVFYTFRNLLERDLEEIASIIHEENGKSMAEGRAAVLKAIELTEFACSLPNTLRGNVQEVSTGVEAKEEIVPVGIVASITPFNFPLMVPMWTIPTTLVTGNAMIVKPSELTPLTMYKIAELLEEAGLPKGVFAIFNGAKEAVEAICDHPMIDTVTFVGSSEVAKIVYRRATSKLKKCLAMGGAKNHIVVSEEVNAGSVSDEIIAAAFGMSGQRCMAASTVLFVGNCEHVKEALLEKTRKMMAGTDLPPLVSKENVNKIKEYLSESLGTILIDGRDTGINGNKEGYYIGPSIIEYDAYEKMPKEEIFGPTIEIVHFSTLEEALLAQAMSPYANGASIFTDSGRYAQEATKSFASGMIGINIGVPVPRDPFSFGGLKQSKFGVGDITGYGLLPLLTNTKKITTKWNAKDRKDWTS